MLNWIDILILVIIIVGCIDGLNKGLVVSVINMARIVVSLIFAKIFSPYISTLIIGNTSIYTKLAGVFEKRLISMKPTTLALISILTKSEQGLPERFASFLISILSFIFVFIVISSLLIMTRDIVRALIKKTPVRHLDNIGGLGFGFIRSLLFIFILFALLSPLILLLPQDNFIVLAVVSSKFAKYFITYNIITPLIKLVTST